MTTENRLLEIATDIARHSHQQKTVLEREILGLEAQLAQKKFALDAANLALDRLANLKVKIGGDYQCPSCWVKDETRSVLKPVGGGTSAEDYFRCPRCELHVTVPF
jgi:hypothetical protein